MPLELGKVVKGKISRIIGPMCTYCFIRLEDGTDDIFAHLEKCTNQRALVPEIHTGASVALVLKLVNKGSGYAAKAWTIELEDPQADHNFAPLRKPAKKPILWKEIRPEDSEPPNNGSSDADDSDDWPSRVDDKRKKTWREYPPFSWVIAFYTAIFD